MYDVTVKPFILLLSTSYSKFYETITKIKNTHLSAIHTFMGWRTTYKRNVVIIKTITFYFRSSSNRSK